MASSRESDLITQSAARELLERAGEIDANSTTVDSLRAAALEAGISEAAFEAALIEMRSRKANELRPEPPRKLRRWLMALAAGSGLLLMVGLLLIPRTAEPRRASMVVKEILVQCLPMNVAQDIARVELSGSNSEVRTQTGSRVLRISGTAAQLERVEAALARAAAQPGACQVPPSGR